MRRAWVVAVLAVAAVLAVLAVAGVLAVAAGAGGGAESGDGGGGGDGYVLVVRVSGGIAGVNDVITVAADGAVTVERRAGVEERRLGAEELAELTALLAGPEFAALPGDVTGSPVADAFTYDFRYGGRAVRADDTSLVPPLDEILALIRL
ncbi:hypothetical protein [Streptomyces millisiae]|uniref:Uncharacterized protein n=1 Tax=Streptomyces millisiae TaxID=3075542 RepID=A0ABU2LIH8_9ACTN|nr:hypothetical protein [Streptomyces sp. DSM 44918]MDT0317392.1 hypothetical protein [Streptomyces sp. DSM 44918]